MSKAPEGYKKFGELSADEQNELLQHWVNHRVIESYHPTYGWSAMICPEWFVDRCYRKPVVMPSVNWDHLTPDIVAIATDKCGTSWAYANKPVMGSSTWSGAALFKVSFLSSFDKGTCSWEDSLIERPLPF